MLGVRGVRLAVIAPQTLTAQLHAILDAVARAVRDGVGVRCGLLIPMVSHLNEIHHIRTVLDDLRDRDNLAPETTPIRLGAMIETPRAAMLAASIAPHVDFLSIGTNDLTALLWGMSRDDAETELLPVYRDLGLVATSPFGDFDLDGLGPLLHRAVRAAKAANPRVSIGVCGDQRIDAASIDRFKSIGVDYLSCSPPRLLRARLVAAQNTTDATTPPGNRGH
jgi:pyruvate,orthophosphate dikinase